MKEYKILTQDELFGFRMLWHADCMTRNLLCLFSIALLTMPAFASSSYLLPVKDSDGRSVLYFADHELKAVDAKAEYAVVMVHGVNGGREDCTGRVRRIMGAHAFFDGKAVYLWGDDGAGQRTRYGSLFAVYGFLEKALGVRWVRPGDEANPGTQDQVIRDWLDAGTNEYLNICASDSRTTHCRCDGCRALDADLPGDMREAWPMLFSDKRLEAPLWHRAAEKGVCSR